MSDEPDQQYTDTEQLRLRVTDLEAELADVYASASWRSTAPLRAAYRGMMRLLQNARRAFRLLGWLATGQYSRAGNAVLPYYRRYVPLWAQEMVPYRIRWAVSRRLRAAHHLSMLRVAAPDIYYVPLLEGQDPLTNPPVKLIALYLPQFHQIPENDAFWGEGFTDWVNVQAAKPQFAGHYQPRVPGELGYYDLRDPKVQHRQVELAKLYGVGGFCLYFYWFNGRRPLEKPLLNYLNDPTLDLPFCLCWANENWTRRWDGRENELLLAQNHSPEDDLAFIEYISKYMRDPRYIRIDGKPLLVVYRPNLLPSPAETAGRWREWCRKNGIGELYLAYTQSFVRVDPALYDFDAAIEFPPNMKAKSFELPNLSWSVKRVRRDFHCEVLDWGPLVELSRKYVNPGYKLFRAVCPSWDNTPRRKNFSRVLVNYSPRGYHEWLLNAIEDTRVRFPDTDERIVFANAWNEWGEGAYLEPDAGYGYAYLEATRLALAGATYLPLSKDGATWISAYLQGQVPFARGRPVVLLCAHYSGPHVFGGERSLLDILDGLHTIGANVICTVPSTENHNYIRALQERSTGVYILPYQQWSPYGEDEAIIEKFVEIIQRHGVNIVYANTIVLREPLTAARRCGIMTVTHAREIITHDKDLARQIGLPPAEIVKRVLERSDYIIANSQSTAECYGQSKSVMVVPNTVDIEQLELDNRVDPADVRFALVSNNLPKKGLSDVIELARRCESSAPNARFLIIGPDNLYVEGLKKDQQKGSVPQNVQFLGFKHTPREAMAEANVVLMLSHFKESFGRTVIEAMAARRPVIAYDWGAPSELIRNGETGFLVEFQNMEHLVDRVKAFCENPDLIPRMGEQGRAFVSEHYSKERYAERLKQAYSDIMRACYSLRNLCNLNLLRAAPQSAIIIPVYNAYEEVQECVRSVQQHTNLRENRLIVIDDASTDERVREFLEGLDNIEFVRNEQNIGYTRTCNKGISLAAPCDVVLLNSDTLVTPRWLESLRTAAYSAAEIGSATALSDNAGAFSVPIPNQQNRKPDGIDYADYARLMRQFCGSCEIPDVPSGNGFCMFVKRGLIDAIGDFDAAAFPRGYGEENDFCMRAVNAGWRNVIAPAAFVFHHREASFGTEKDRLLVKGMRVIRKRYPDYAKRVKDAFSSPVMENLRKAAQRAPVAAAAGHARTQLAVLKPTGGRANMERDQGSGCLFMLADGDKISLPQADEILGNHSVLIPMRRDSGQEFATWLLRYGIDSVEVDGRANLAFDVKEVCDLVGVPCTSWHPE
jgi:glycosyltransferase involved in cell wall biosynthesis/GT2 family glycosyltransferase